MESEVGVIILTIFSPLDEELVPCSQTDPDDDMLVQESQPGK